MTGAATAEEAACAGHYARAFARHGDTPRGVDWNDADAQALRLRVLLKHAAPAGAAVLDLGCGTGALLDEMDASGEAPPARYLGLDLVAAMVDAARTKHRGRAGVEFRAGGLSALRPGEAFDWVIASGIFNTPGGTPAAAWRRHVRLTIEGMWRACRVGIAFNVLSAAADKPRPDLHHEDPADMLRFLQTGLSRHALLDHGGRFFEFAAAVTRDPTGPA